MPNYTLHRNSFEGLASAIANLPWREYDDNGVIGPLHGAQDPKKRMDWLNKLLTSTGADHRAAKREALNEIYSKFTTHQGAGGKKDADAVIDAMDSIFFLEGVPGDSQPDGPAISFWRHAYEKLNERIAQEHRQGIADARKVLGEFLTANPAATHQEIKDHLEHRFGTPPIALTAAEAGY